MRDRIWTELIAAKHNEEFASLYSDSQRLRLRIFNIGILLFSSGGLMGLKFWDKAPIAACIIISTISILRLVQPHLIFNDKLVSNLDTIHDFYTSYYNKLEKLWYDLEAKRIDETTASTQFFKIKATETEHNPMIAETIRSKPKKIVQKARQHSINYLNQVFKTSNT